MDTGEVVVKLGHVESTFDDSFGLRIKARIEEDANLNTAELPDAFPLMPKMFQVLPKVGECVLIFTSKTGNKKSQRYYIGPVVSQPQYFDNCEFQYGRGPAMALLSGATVGPLENINNYEETEGAFPNGHPLKRDDDVAMVGRTSQDIIFRHNDDKNTDEVNIRCGVREKSPVSKEDNPSLVGNIIFNAIDPAYIQLKYGKNLVGGNETNANSVINLVADKINIISNKDDNSFNLTDNDEMIQKEELEGIMNQLHQIPHGDTLLKFLDIFKKAFLTHSHNYAQLPPTYAGNVKAMDDYPLQDILSKHVRIS